MKSRENPRICFTCSAAPETWASSGSGAERSGLGLTGRREEEVAGAETARAEQALSEAARLTPGRGPAAAGTSRERREPCVLSPQR